MILLATGLKSLEEELLRCVPGEVKTCYHRIALPAAVREYRPEAVIISPHLEGDGDIVETVRRVRNFGVRVVFLPGEEGDSRTRQLIKSLLPLGVYDFVYDPVTAEKVVFRLANPGKLGDFAGTVEMDERVVEGLAAGPDRGPGNSKTAGTTADQGGNRPVKTAGKNRPAGTTGKGWLTKIRRLFSLSPVSGVFGAKGGKTDYLTGCSTREEMKRQIERLLSKGKLFSVAMVDFDDFKRVNDTCGHQAGDRILALFGDFLRGNLREQDTAYRYGGEEFVIVFAETSPEDARRVLERLQAEWVGECSRADTGVVPTFSAGVSLGAWSAEKTIENADKALYAAKRQGKNKTVVYSAGLENKYSATAAAAAPACSHPAPAGDTPENTPGPASRGLPVPRRAVGTGGGHSPAGGRPQAPRPTGRVRLSEVFSPGTSQTGTGQDARFIMVYSSASGVGKTAVSISLAQVLSGRSRVLLVDADTSGYTLTEHFAGITFGRIPFAPVRPEGWGFDLLPVPGGPDQYTRDRVQQVFSYLQGYDCIIVDGAPGTLALHPHIKSFLEKADTVFLLCTPEAKAIGAVRRFMGNEANAIAGLKNKTRFVVNRMHPLADRTPEQIAEETGVNVDWVLPEDKVVEKMFTEARPLGEPNSEFFRSLQGLVNKENLRGGVFS